MNQKQRDLLCKMVDREVKKIHSRIIAQFPILEKTYGNRYRYMIVHMSNDIIKALPSDLRKTYALLKRRDEEIRQKENKLDNDCEKWDSDFDEYRKKEVAKSEKMFRRLEEAAHSATIDIQFAENADEARKIIANLPTVEQLISDEN